MEKFNFSNKDKYAEYVLSQSNILLDKCRIYGDAEERKGLMINILNSICAKSWLMEIFEKSPYHNGKGQLIIPMETKRPVDKDVIRDYSSYIRTIAKRYLLPEATINGYTYQEAYDEYNNIERFVRAIRYMNLSDDDVVIKGKPFGEYRKLYEEMIQIIHKFGNYDDYYYKGDNCYTERENLEKYNKAIIIADAIYHCVGHLLEDEDDIKTLAEVFPHSQCRAGVKISRVVQKCMKEIGLYDLAIEGEKKIFNKKYAEWTDAVTPQTITKWSVLSINFVDFLTMSHGNSWTSCLNTDKDCHFTSGKYRRGFNSKRVLDYALDPSTMVFYTVDEDYKGDDWELQPKLTRQLFHFGENKLVQARLYPQSNVGRRETYNQYRDNVERLLAEALGEANLWSAPERGMISLDKNIVTLPYYYKYNGDFIDFLDIATHGDDERNFQEEVNYVVFRGSESRDDNGVPMTIGSTNAVCIMCGEEFDEGIHESIACYDCRD